MLPKETKGIGMFGEAERWADEGFLPDLSEEDIPLW